jgi:nitrate reductase cytochrome c-type subunit
VLYGNDGLSRSGDPTISKVAPGHPIRHEITNKVTIEQCLHCHNNEGARIGLAYTGKVASKGSAPYQADGTQPPLTYGICILPLGRGDVHYEKGLSCIDCHVSRELHGNGTLYSTMKEEVVIRCENCHGTPYEAASLKDSSGKPLTNLYRQGDEVILVAKITGKKHTVPQMERLMARSALPAAMSIPGHVKEVKGKNQSECYSCHSLMVPQYYGYSFRRDDRKIAPLDWVKGTGERREPTPLQGTWSMDYAYLRWEDPVFGINTKGRVSPYLPLYQGFSMHIGEEGEQITEESSTTSSRFPKLCMVPVQPHTTSKRSLHCAYCHSDSKALGQYAGGIDTVAQGWPISFPLERIVDEQGTPLQETFYPGARPFSKQELDRIDRVNSCLNCHKLMENETAWKEVTDSFGVAETNARHNEIVERVFRKGTSQ